MNKKLAEMAERLKSTGTSEARRRLHMLAEALEDLHKETDPEILKARTSNIKKDLHEVIAMLKELDDAEGGAPGEEWQEIQDKRPGPKG